MNAHPLRRKIILTTIATWTMVTGLCVQLAAEQRPGAKTAPWWKQEKIRFFWGQWAHALDTGISMEERIRNASRAGATVFVDQGSSHLNRARLARKHGLRYFGAIKLSTLARFLAQFSQQADPAPRLSVNREGQAYAGGAATEIPGFQFACPLYKPLYEAWFFKPALDLAKTGLVDGFHADWEAYGGKGEAEICYCDDCFGKLLAKKGLPGEPGVPKARRFVWLVDHNLVEEYELLFEKRRADMFRQFAHRVRRIKPDFVFSGYNLWDSPISQGLNSTKVPFFLIDQRHYYEDHTRPWWESHQAHYRRLGYVRIAGSFDNTLFGGQPEYTVSAAQVMYDHAINTDGYWTWFEQELTPDTWRTFWIANQRIAATEQKVGQFLLHGVQDIHFLTPVVWSGRPDFDRKIIQRTYHLGDEHLVHIHNVDADRPMQIRIRFPRLPRGTRWVVTDPVAELTYIHGDSEALWSVPQLTEGLVICMPKRSELFVKLTPASDGPRPNPSAVIASARFRPMPVHPETTGPPLIATAMAGPQRLVYTVAESLGYRGREGGWAIGNAIHAIDANGGNHKRLYQTKGYLWSPAWSPDGTRIAFCHFANGSGQIFVMNADSSGIFNLSRNSYCDKSPVWSPDGSRIAFLSDRDADWEIYVMNVDGSHQTRLTNSAGIDQAPAWSPDSAHVVFESNRRGDFDLYTVNADGTDERLITNSPGDEQLPAWSSDGKHIAFIGMGSHLFRDLQVLEIGTAQARSVMQHPHIGPPRWSPNLKQIAGSFRGPQESDHAGIFLKDADSVRKLVDIPAQRPYSSKSRRRPRPSWYSSGSASPRWVVQTFTSVRWSADGKTLAFSSDMDGDGYFHIYTTDAESGESKRLKSTASAWPQQLMWCPR